MSEKISKKSPTGDSKTGSKSCQNATWGMKTRLFGCFCPTLAWSVFVKGLFRQFQRLASPAKAGFGGKMLKGQKSQWCESHQKQRTTPLLSEWKWCWAGFAGRLSFAFICHCTRWTRFGKVDINFKKTACQNFLFLETNFTFRPSRLRLCFDTINFCSQIYAE